MKTLKITSSQMSKHLKKVANLLAKVAAISKTSKTRLTSGAVLGGGALVALTLAFAYPANTPPGLADLQAVVTQTAPPNSPGSTSSFKTGDQIQFTGAFKAPDIPVPQWESHVTEFGAGQLYVNGSTLTPSGSGYKTSYLVGTTWQTTEPASGALVSKIKYTYNPNENRINAGPPGSFGTAGAGDGFQVISFQDKVYLVNHHAAPPAKFMKCYVFVNGVTNECPGWLGGRSGGPGIISSNVTTAEVNRSTSSPDFGKLYYPAAKSTPTGFESGFACFHLINAAPCAVNFISYASYDSTVDSDAYTRIIGLGNVGGNVYAAHFDGEIFCLNVTTGQKCPTDDNQSYRFIGASFQFTAGGINHDNNLPGRNPANTNYIFAHGNSTSNGTIAGSSLAGGPVYCFNATLNKTCAGNWPVLGLNGALSMEERITTNADGSFKSVCLMTANPNNARCVDATGNQMPFPNGMSKQVSLISTIGSSYFRTTGYTTTPTADYPTPRRRIYSLTENETVLCYDEADAAPCAGFSMTRATPAEQSGISGYIYSIVHDPERPNCLWTDSDSGYVHSFDALTGGFCTSSGGKITLKVKPIDAYKCNPAEANITGWDAIVTSGEPTNNLTVKIFNPLTNTQIGADLSFPAGQQHINIGNIPNISYATYPELKIEIINNSSSTIGNLVADVTWKGSPKQFCSKVTAGADCVASAKFTASSTDNPTLAYTELVPLNKLLIKDQARQGFGAGSAVSSTDIKNNPLIFRGTFDEVTLSGDLTVARYIYKPADTPPTLGPGAVLVSASSPGVTPPHSSRNVITQLPPSSADPNAITNTVGFEWANLDPSQQNLLSKPAPGATSQALDAAFGQKRLNYLRGDSADEIINGGLLRSRAGTARTMGMVLGSSLVYLPTYGSMGFSEVAQPGYSAFAQATGRTKPTVFVNANDGMLHAYKIDDQGGSSVTMTEQFAYLPRSLLAKMPEYTDKTNAALVQAPYFNDSTPMVADIKLNSTWSTVLASAFGRGAKGLYMLNVTKADAVTQSNPQNLAIREFTDANDVDMGYIVSQPAVNDLNLSSQIVQVKTSSGLRPAVIVGNGMNSANGVAALFIIYLDTTGGYLKIPMPATAIAGVANGLSTPRVLTNAVAGVADRVYAGDLYGNMWAIDISDLSTVPEPYLLFNTGVDASGKPLPIATAPTAMLFNPENAACANCWMVNFATGKPTTGVLLYDTDIPQQTAYGIWDKGAGAAVLKTKLVEQSIDVTTAQGSTVTNRTVDYTSANVLGWFMALPSGQMTVANPFLRPNGTFVMFTIKQVFATAGMCTAGDGDVYEVISFNGNTMPQTIDINGDLQINNSDLIPVVGPNGNTNTAAATRSVGEAQRGASQVVQLTPGSGLESKVLSSGKSVLEVSPNGNGPKRISWREIVN